MTCKTIPNGIICMANDEFHCPYCNNTYFDAGGRYVEKCNKNKCGYTKIKCLCGETFGMTYDIKGDAVGFKLKPKGWHYI